MEHKRVFHFWNVLTQQPYVGSNPIEAGGYYTAYQEAMGAPGNSPRSFIQVISESQVVFIENIEKEIVKDKY